MYLEEVLPALRKGAKIRRKSWSEDEYIYLTIDNRVLDDEFDYYSFDTRDVISLDDWKIYEERIEDEEDK